MRLNTKDIEIILEVQKLLWLIEYVDFACVPSGIKKGVRLHPAQQACNLSESILYIGSFSVCNRFLQ